MFMIALGQEIACADVQKKSSDGSETQTEHRCLELKHHRSGGSSDRRHRIKDEPSKRSSIAASVFKDQANGIDAIREVMDEYSHCNESAHGTGDFEGEPDRDSVKKAVDTQTPCPNSASPRKLPRPWTLIGVKNDRAIQYHIG